MKQNEERRVMKGITKKVIWVHITCAKRFRTRLLMDKNETGCWMACQDRHVGSMRQIDEKTPGDR